jgi:hypothetical protein
LFTVAEYIYTLVTGGEASIVLEFAREVEVNGGGAKPTVGDHVKYTGVTVELAVNVVESPGHIVLIGAEIVTGRLASGSMPIVIVCEPLQPNKSSPITV